MKIMQKLGSQIIVWLYFIAITYFILHCSLHSQAPTNSESAKKEKRSEVFKLGEIVVTATKVERKLDELPIPARVVTEEEIKLTGAQNVADALRAFTDINISTAAKNSVGMRSTAVMQGLPAQYSLILIDGKRAKSEHIHTGVNLDLIPVELIERIEIVEGPASALYGSDAIGGVINIITKGIPDRLKTDISTFYGSNETRNFNLYHGARISERFGYNIFLNANRSDGYRKDLWYDRKNFKANLGYFFTDKDKLLFSGLYYKGKYETADDYNRELGLDYTREFSPNNTLNLKIYRVYYNRTGKSRDKNITTDGELRYSQAIGKHQLTGGIEFRREDFERLAVPKKHQNVFALYLQDEVPLSEKIGWLLSSRVETYEGVDTQLTPQTALKWSVSDKTDLRIGVSRGFRAPSLQELYEYHYDHTIFLRDGNPDLKSENSMNYFLETTHKIKEGFLIKAKIFRNDIKDMIALVDTGTTDPSGKPILRRENIEEAYTQGINLEVKKQLSRYLTLVSEYAFLQTKDKTTDLPVTYTPKHTVKTQLYFEKGGFSTAIIMETVMDRVFLTTPDNKKQKLDDYSIVDMNLGYKISEKFSLSASVKNLLDEKYDVFEYVIVPGLYLGRTFLVGARLSF